MATKPEKFAAIERSNHLSAQIILATPEKFEGLPLVWANLYMHDKESDMMEKFHHQNLNRRFAVGHQAVLNSQLPNRGTI